MKNLSWLGPMLALGLLLGSCTEGAGVTGDGCPPVDPCGDGVIDAMGGEACDPGNAKTGAPMNLGTSTCSTLGASGDGLTCNCRCQFDMDRCIDSASSGMGGSF